MKEKVESKILGAFVDTINMEPPKCHSNNGTVTIPRVMVGFSIEDENGEGFAFHIGDSLSIFSAEDYE